MKSRSQQAVALVITLIMLAVITLVTVAYLALAHRDRSAAISAEELSRAEHMSDTARERAIAETAAQMLGAGNLLGFDMIVTRNVDIFTNNALIDPRAPVWVVRPNGKREPLHYLDLNRNAVEDFPGALPSETGDPYWIGVTERFGPHGPDNPYIGRYCFLVQPAGKSLDLNFIHNQIKQSGSANWPVVTNVEGYVRSQGLGSWELNLPAFLVDLNTNVWPPAGPWLNAYNYVPNGPNSFGQAFYDALDLLRYRYSGSYTWLSNAPPTLGVDLGEQTRFWAGSDNPRHFYSLSELFNKQRTYAAFATKLQWAMAAANPNRDFQTFYRLLGQLGMDSVPDTYDKTDPEYTIARWNGFAPERARKVNLNYINLNGTNVATLTPWTANPPMFFTNVAKRLLRKHPELFGVDVSGDNFVIQIYPTNCYTPAVHQLLQLAANLYDAAQTNNLPPAHPPGWGYSSGFPTIFRPIFGPDPHPNAPPGSVAILGYVDDNGQRLLADLTTPAKWKDVLSSGARGTNVPAASDFVYGIPLIVGAKKGFPNFNKFVLDTGLVVERKVEVLKKAPNLKPYGTNQLYLLSITNRLGVEGWNSYLLPYPRSLSVVAAVQLTTILTDTDNSGTPVLVPLPSGGAFATNLTLTVPAGAWLGTNYQLIQFTNVTTLPLSEYKTISRQLNLGQSLTGISESTFRVPDWTIAASGKLIFFIYDSDAQRVVDVVNLGSLAHSTNVFAALLGTSGSDTSPILSVWKTNGVSPPEGILNQIKITTGDISVSVADWSSYKGGSLLNGSPAADKENTRTNFINYLKGQVGMVTNMEAFAPASRVYVISSWQANDPLVHYTLADLRDELMDTQSRYARYRLPLPFNQADPYNLRKLNKRYRPWPTPGSDGVNYSLAFDYTVQDSLVRGSDDWNFPEGKLPNIGWLGRVHRGTPWQTVYLKADVAPALAWHSQVGGSYWTVLSGLVAAPTNWTFVAADTVAYATHPTNDWRILDIFTVAPDDNASRGTLSINQANQAAWSAVLSGTAVLVNTNSDGAVSGGLPPVPLADGVAFGHPPIDPATVPLSTIVAAINRQRGNRIYNSLGEILATPELTTQSPFLNATATQKNFGLTDDAYEAIPQQILSLLRVGEPRVVVYAFGQSLKPATVSSSAQGGIPARTPLNYKVTGEHATRSVVRFDDITPAPTPQVPNPRMKLRPVIESYNILPPE